MVEVVEIVLRILCWIVLAVYALRAMRMLIAGTTTHPDSGLRESLAAAYAAASIYYVSRALPHLSSFSLNLLSVAGDVDATLPSIWYTLFAIAGMILTSAFLWNCSRSIYVLTALDHGEFGSAPNWIEAFKSRRKKGPEFLLRTICAVLFLNLEHRLFELGSASGGDAERSQLISHLGLWGVFLYAALLVWWSAVRLIGAKVPGSLLWFFFSGFAVAGFHSVFARPDPETWYTFLLWAMILVGTGMALYMHWFVLCDIASAMRAAVRRCQLVTPHVALDAGPCHDARAREDLSRHD